MELQQRNLNDQTLSLTFFQIFSNLGGHFLLIRLYLIHNIKSPTKKGSSPGSYCKVISCSRAVFFAVIFPNTTTEAIHSGMDPTKFVEDSL